MHFSLGLDVYVVIFYCKGIEKLNVQFLGRSGTTGLWPLVVQFLLWEAESNGDTQWI